MLYIRQKLIDLKTQFNSSQKGVTEKMKTDFQNYTFDARANEEIKLRNPIRMDTIAGLKNIINEIPKERTKIQGKIESIKFPNSNSEDVNKKILGENYKQSALIFLSKPRSSEEIITEFKNCLNSKKYETAFTIFDSILDQMPPNGIYTKSQKHLLELITEVYGSFDKKVEIDSLEKELMQIEEIEAMADNFNNQLNRNCNEIVLVHSEMTDSEKAEIQNYIDSGIPAIEAIALKNRLSRIN